MKKNNKKVITFKDDASKVITRNTGGDGKRVIKVIAKNKYSAAASFYRKIAVVLRDRNQSTQQKVTILAGADLDFKQQNVALLHGDQENNFWVLLDKELLHSQAKNPKVTREPNKQALGLLSVVANGAALDKKVFSEIVKIYKAAYEQKAETTLLLQALDHQNSNLLHVVCQALASYAEKGSLGKSEWEVYDYLIKNSNYQQLLKAVNSYNCSPSQLLERTELIVDGEQQFI